MTKITLRNAARLLCALLALSVGEPAAFAQTRDKLVVASKIDTEGALLGHMILIALERAGVPVENRLQLGPTKIVRTALVSGEIDLYPEYTGNGAFFFSRENDPAWRAGASRPTNSCGGSISRPTSSSGSTAHPPTTPG